jgi:hypothetical protein
MKNGFLAQNSPFQRLIGSIDDADNYLIHFMNSPHVQVDGNEQTGIDATLAKANGGMVNSPGALDRFASTLPPEQAADTEGQSPMTQKLAASRNQKMLQKQRSPAGLGKIVGRSGDNRFV